MSNKIKVLNSGTIREVAHDIIQEVASKNPINKTLNLGDMITVKIYTNTSYDLIIKAVVGKNGLVIFQYEFEVEELDEKFEERLVQIFNKLVSEILSNIKPSFIKRVFSFIKNIFKK